ncbi:MAG: 30S ribosomal protein S2, partial [Tateyamaria sp.]|nr:30S ribosomal protein S2 [Tateyamaria sp.]
ARAIGLYCDLAARAALDGMSAQLGAAGVDLGAMEEAPVEEALTTEATEAEAPVVEAEEVVKEASEA